MDRIQQLTGLTRDERSLLIYEQGEQYLQERFGPGSQTCRALRHSRYFWNWWKMLWESIDRDIENRTHSYINRRVYLDFHRFRKGQFFLPDTVVRLSIKREAA